MDIVWDEDKNNWLKAERGISFEEITDHIIQKHYIDIIENPTRPDQLYFVMLMHDYTWIIPFLLNEKDQIMLKTAFKSRKYHKLYAEDKNES